ncbi:MAG: chloride channel protein [Methermicoccaceae archaeon]
MATAQKSPGRFSQLSHIVSPIMRWERRYIEDWLPSSIVVGVLCGIAGVVLYALLQLGFTLILSGIGGYAPPDIGAAEAFAREPATFEKLHIIWLLPALGGLAVGLLSMKVPEVARAGTDAYIRAFQTVRGSKFITVPAEILGSMLTITSGGSAGVQGPTVFIGSTIGYQTGRLFKKSNRMCRLLMVCGAAGGLSAIFRTPFGAALFASGVLYKNDMETDAILPAFLSSIVSYSIFYGVYRLGPLFVTPEYTFKSPSELVLYILLGMFVAGVGLVYVNVYRSVLQVFDTARIPRVLKPALGGLGVGLLVLLIESETGTGLALLGMGYEIVQYSLFEHIPLTFIVVLLLGKILATSLTIGSRGAGGVFAPTIEIGALAGGAFAGLLSIAFPSMEVHTGALVLIGMAAMLACASKSLLASIVLVTELTGNYFLLPGLMLASTVSMLLTSGWCIYGEQEIDRLHSPAHMGEMTMNVLERIKVEDAMTREVITVPPHASVADVLKKVHTTGHRGYPVVDESRGLVGIITYRDAERIAAEKRCGPVSSAMCEELITAYPDEPLADALKRLVANGISRLPVVSRDEPTQLLGILTERDVVVAHARVSAKIVCER